MSKEESKEYTTETRFEAIAQSALSEMVKSAVTLHALPYEHLRASRRVAVQSTEAAAMRRGFLAMLSAAEQYSDEVRRILNRIHPEEEE